MLIAVQAEWVLWRIVSVVKSFCRDVARSCQRGEHCGTAKDITLDSSGAPIHCGAASEERDTCDDDQELSLHEVRENI